MRSFLLVSLLSLLSFHAPVSTVTERNAFADPGSDDLVDGFAPGRYTDSTGTMPYRLFVPRNYDPKRTYPLVVWLHGSGGLGTDNLQQILGDQIPGTRAWTKPVVQAAHPAFVLVPQSNTSWAAPPPLSSKGQMVPTLIKSIATRFQIDRKRIYITGQSLGGAGAWSMISTAPELFAGALILCPAVAVPVTPPPSAVPTWLFVGDLEAAGIITATKAMDAALKKVGGKPRLTVYPGLGHSIWTRTFAEPELVEWLYAQHR
jgi:predicted peptidase